MVLLCRRKSALRKHYRDVGERLWYGTLVYAKCKPQNTGSGRGDRGEAEAGKHSGLHGWKQVEILFIDLERITRAGGLVRLESFIQQQQQQRGAALEGVSPHAFRETISERPTECQSEAPTSVVPQKVIGAPTQSGSAWQKGLEPSDHPVRKLPPMQQSGGSSRCVHGRERQRELQPEAPPPCGVPSSMRENEEMVTVAAATAGRPRGEGQCEADGELYEEGSESCSVSVPTEGRINVGASDSSERKENEK